MNKLFFVFFLFVFASSLKAQHSIVKDTLFPGKVVVIKDNRLDVLAKKEAEFNEALALGSRVGKGYRLMVLSTNDRALAMNLRATLLQRFPEQKVYMSFQPPYIKLKFGNFLERSEADQYKKDITNAKLVNTNIYIVPENIELKPDKNKDKDIL